MKELDIRIASEEKLVARLQKELADAKLRLKLMRETRRVIAGEPTPKAKPTLPDLIENILRRKKSAMHLDQILEELARQRLERQPAKATITTTLLRLAKQGRRFRHVGPNTFDLIREE